jgi:HSP20 family molecular chaperone IbpA
MMGSLMKKYDLLSPWEVSPMFKDMKKPYDLGSFWFEERRIEGPVKEGDAREPFRVVDLGESVDLQLDVPGARSSSVSVELLGTTQTTVKVVWHRFSEPERDGTNRAEATLNCALDARGATATVQDGVLRIAAKKLSEVDRVTLEVK